MVDCPECKRPDLKRLVSAAAFRLKGGGWYETDFKDKNKRNLADSGDGKSTKSKSDKADSKSGGSSEKPAKKTGSGSSAGKTD